MSKPFESRVCSPPHPYYNSGVKYKESSHRTIKKGLETTKNFSEMSLSQSNQSFKVNRQSYENYIQPEDKVIKELNFLEKEINSVRGSNDRIMNEINEIKNMISDRIMEAQFSNDDKKNEMHLMEDELEGLINEERKLEEREEEAIENCDLQREKLTQEQSSFELYNEANILLKKELEELERELEMLKNCELSESTMQESFSTLLEQINLIKQRFIKGYAVIIMDKLFNNMNKSIVKDSFRKIFNNNDPHLKEIFLLKIFKKTNDGLRVHFKKLWSLLSTKKVEETLSLRKFYVKTNEINKMMISHETLKD